jgi:general secretion pathway protein H
VKNKGFSLVEVIVVLVLIGVSISLLAPSLSRFSKAIELKATVKKISAILRYCRSEAINKGKVYQVFFDSESREVKVQPMAASEEKGEDVKKDVKKDDKSSPKTYPLPVGVNLKEVKTESPEYPSDLPTIEFYPNGGSNGGTILLDMEDHNGYRITVNFLTGIVAVEKV